MSFIKLPAAKPAFSLIPYAIIATFVLFAAYIGSFVYRAMRTRTELVSANYYEQELGYQDRIAAASSAAALPGGIRLTAGVDRLVIQLPPALAGQVIRGEVRFVRPADARLDFTVPFRPTDDLSQEVSMAALQPGHWRVELDFTANRERYFVKEAFQR